MTTWISVVVFWWLGHKGIPLELVRLLPGVARQMDELLKDAAEAGFMFGAIIGGAAGLLLGLLLSAWWRWVNK